MVVRRSDLETSCELLWCELTDDQGSKYLFGVFYRQPNTNVDYMELLGDSLSRISNSNVEKIFLVGDFNLPDFDWINQLPLSSDQLYLNSFEIFNDVFRLTQVNHHATRNSNILDLILTTAPNLVHSVSVSEGLLNSDHRSVTFFLNINNNPVHKRPKYFWNLKKPTWRSLRKLYKTYRATAMLDNDVNINLINWEDLFWTAVNEFVPQKRINDKRTPPWIDKEVKDLCRRKDRASTRALRTKDSRDMKHFQSLRRSCTSLVRSEYNAYLSQLADNIQDNPKKFWSFYSRSKPKPGNYR